MHSPAPSAGSAGKENLQAPAGAEDVFVFPASFGQHGLWLVDQFNPASTAYSLPVLLRVAGALDVEVLERVLNEIVQRHEILRTTFSLQGDRLVQVISQSARVSLPIDDLSSLPEPEREARAFELARAEIRRPFDLGRGPLFRACLWRLGERDHVLLLCLDHLVADWWSFAVLFRELTALYRAFTRGEGSPLPDLALQYADFSQWQHERMRGKNLEENLSYWKAALAGAPPVLDLLTDRPRAPRQTSPGACESGLLSVGLSAQLKALSRREGVTPFMTLLAAFFTLLSRHTGQTDLVVGSPIANRTRVELESLIGLMMNTLVLRADLSGNPTFRELLARVGRSCVEAYAHQEMPFEKLLEELNPERTLSHSPLFQVLVTLQNAPAVAPRLEGLSVTPLPVEVETSKFDLAVYFDDSAEQISTSLHYNTDLFEASTVRWMLGHFHALLAGIVSDPDRPLSRLPILAEADRKALPAPSHEIGPTVSFLEFPKEEIEQSITARFEQQAQRNPSRIAVRTATNTWTYERLAREAERVARSVVELAGSGPHRIGLLFEQDASMLAAILGSLQAGKTYVPLDPSYPAERLAYMVQDSGATLILTNDRNLPLAASLGEGRCAVASLDRLRPKIPASAAAAPTGPETVAYILYTSGSAGQPKGVVQNHGNVLHFIRAYTNRLRLQPDDRMSLLASYSFDAAVMDIFGALLNGATLCLWNFKAQGVAGLASWLAKEEITVLHAVPTVFRAFGGSLNAGQQFPKVRLVVLGGEEVHRGDVELYRRHFSRDCRLINGLGPTESTVALQYVLDHRTALPRNTVPVGYPVDDTEILLLDAEGRPTELRGEIAIRSAHVALGYWGKPEMTQAAFLPDPEGGARRLYRTGDLGRRLPDGAIEFLGRKDFRVKVRGHRIELREIEETLAQTPVGARGRRRRTRGETRRPAADRLPRAASGRRTEPGPAARLSRGEAARFHDALFLRLARRVPPHTERQGGSREPARAPPGTAGRGARFREPPQRARIPTGPDLGKAAGRAPDRRHRQLLRARRALSARGSPADPGRKGDGPHSSAFDHLPGPDRRRHGLQARGGENSVGLVVSDRNSTRRVEASVFLRARAGRQGAGVPRLRAPLRTRSAPLRSCAAGAGRAAPAPRPGRRHGGALRRRDPRPPAAKAPTISEAGPSGAPSPSRWRGSSRPPESGWPSWRCSTPGADRGTFRKPRPGRAFASSGSASDSTLRHWGASSGGSASSTSSERAFPPFSGSGGGCADPTTRSRPRCVALVTPPSSGCMPPIVGRPARTAHSLIRVKSSCSGRRAWVSRVSTIPTSDGATLPESTSKWSKCPGHIARSSGRSRTSALSRKDCGTACAGPSRRSFIATRKPAPRPRGRAPRPGYCTVSGGTALAWFASQASRSVSIELPQFGNPRLESQPRKRDRRGR